METKRFIYYEEDGLFVGWLEEYPDYRTQGETMGCVLIRHGGNHDWQSTS
jgi:predicted RNase H-like HicB family nuclease